VTDIPVPSQWRSSFQPVSHKKSGLDFEVQSFSGNSRLSHPRPRPIRELPCYIEKHTSFTTTSSPSTIFDSLSQILGKLRVDFEFQYLKNKIKGVCHPNNIPCSFRVNVFKTTDAHVVEFQRRSGCVVQFSKFYADVLLAMNTEPKKDSAPTKSEPVSALDQASIANLIRMSSSELVDVQREGLRVLANSVSLEANRKLLLASSEFLTSILSSSDDEVLRLAGVVVNALSGSNSRLGIPVAETVFSVLSKNSLNSLIGRDTKRQLTQAIAGYTKSHSQHFVHHPRASEFVSCLEQFTTSADVATRNASSAALECLFVY